MADFSLTTLFVVPKGVAIATTGSTQDLLKGVVGFYGPKGGPPLVPYTVLTGSDLATAPYFQVAQGRENTYLQGTKRSDKIKICGATPSCNSNVIELYKVPGCATAAVQITDIGNWVVNCGDVVTLTLRGHSSYLDTIAFNGWTRSVTVQAPCCDCGDSPCDLADIDKLIDALIAKLNASTPGTNPDNLKLSQFYTFERVGTGAAAVLRISGKPLTKYGQPCDVAAFPYEYDRMWFRAFVYEGPATTADFIVADNCNIIATPVVKQRSSYPRGTAEEIKQMEINFHSYQAGYLKHLYRMMGYNGNFESWVSAGDVYDTYYIKFTDLYKGEYQWGDYIEEDQTVIIAAVAGSAESTTINTMLLAAIGGGATALPGGDQPCLSTTTTTSSSTTTTTSTTTLIP